MAVKASLFFCLTFLTFFAWAQDSTPTPPPISLEVPAGIDVIEKLDFDFNTKVTIGNEPVLKLVLIPQKKEIIFKGLKLGRSSVTIRDTLGDIRRVYEVVVTGAGTSKTISELNELIGDIEGIEIGIKGGKVFVGGEIVVPEDIGRLDKILASYPDVLTIVELSPQTQRVIARKMQDELAKNNLKDVTVRIVNGIFWLEGVVSSTGKVDLALKIASAYLPPKITTTAQGSSRFADLQKDAIVSFIGVNAQKEPAPAAKMVKITSQFVELSKTYNKIFAFKWAPLMGQDGSSISIGQTASGNVTTTSHNTLSATISNLFPKLNAAKTAGYARVIQSGMIIMKEDPKNQATIEKKTTIPFAVGTGDFSKASTAQIGLVMGVTSSIKEQENVEMGISLAISSQTGSTSPPVTTNNEIKTTIVIKSKESAAIGGIVQNTSTTDYDNEPASSANAGTGQNGGPPPSPLFRLYRSKSYIANKSQYVIFITPEIIENAAVGTEEIRRKFRRRE